MILAQIASQLVSLAVLAVLYRVLGPEPYGLLGMVLPLLLLVRIFVAWGLDTATIQQADLTDEQVSALFWLNQALGLAMAAVTAAMAPVMVWFYGVRQLGWITVAVAGTSVANVLGIQHQALLQREFRLGALAAIRVVALAAGGASGIAAAVAGWGVWALVLQQYVELLVLAAGAWILVPWRPGLVLRGARIAHLVRFGGDYTLSSLMFYLVANADKILVGFVLGPRALGLYSQAFNLMMKPVHVVITPLTGIMLPALSRAAADRQQYARLMLDFFRFIAAVMLPAGLGLAIVAPEAIRVLGGPEWVEAGPVLAVLAPAILVQGFFNALGSILASVGRADRLFRGSVVIACVLCTAFTVGIYLGTFTAAPLVAVGLSYSVTLLFVVFPLYLRFCLRTVGVPYRRWLAQLRTPALATAVMAAPVAACHCFLSHLSDPLLLTVEILVGVLTYVLCARREIRRFLEN